MIEPRATCDRCLRPLALCWCAHVVPIETQTRVVFLQHPREAGVAIGTARMAHLCLPRSELHVGVHWAGSRVLQSVHADPTRPAALLYPGEGAIDVMSAPPPHPITLVVIDGTWAQARKIANQNPELAALPRYAFTPPKPSQYRIRAEPDARFVSTIEALSYVLGALEGAPERFEAMLRPFTAMVATQVDYAASEHRTRVRSAPRRAWRGASLPPLLTERRANLVCMAAEANAWPHGHPLRSEAARGELVHLVACRLGTGERFEGMARPRLPLAPNTARHLGVEDAALLGAAPLAALDASLRAFLRDDDVLVTWGSFSTELLAQAGLAGAHERVDLRWVTRVLANRSVGALEDLASWLEVVSLPTSRAQRRLALLEALTQRVLAQGAGLFAPPPRA